MSSHNRVEIVEVGPRDGLQNETVSLPLESKLELINRLLDSGLISLEVTSFVNPTVIPQLADADQLLPRLPVRDDVNYISLVPNERGYDRALAAGAKTVEIFTSATDEFCLANTRCTIEESFARFEPIMRKAATDGLRVRGAVSVAFHCPYSGPVDPELAVAVADQLLELGCYQVVICDTVGKASPDEVTSLLELALLRLPQNEVALHFHDTFGQALENISRGTDAGIRTFDTTIAGLGGCPFAPGAPGNVSTESVNKWCQARGYATGLDSATLNTTASWIRAALGKMAHAS